ncbi:MAG: hypothetical protein ACJ72L_01640 [Marmoricola sp.]
MQPRAGWVVEPTASAQRAHQLAPAIDGEPVGTLCQRYSEAWEPAGPAVERCQDCQLAAAGPHPD